MKKLYISILSFLLISICISCKSTSVAELEDSSISTIKQAEIDHDAEIRKKIEQEPLLIVSYNNYYDTTTITHRLFRHYDVVKKEGYNYSASVNMYIKNEKPILDVDYDGDDWKFMNSITFFVPEPRQKVTFSVDDWDVYRNVGHSGHCYESFYVTIPEDDIETIKNMLNYELQIVIDHTIFCDVNDETKQAILELLNYSDYEIVPYEEVFGDSQ